MSFRIGIDIGGTNTDGVLVNENDEIVQSIKFATTSPLEIGFNQVLQTLLNKGNLSGKEISGVFVGTTHATNAILQAQDLYPVGVIRLAGHQPTTLPSAYGWPKQLHKEIIRGIVTLDGGFECDGRALTELNQTQIISSVRQLLDQGVESFAICGVFSSLYPDQELLTEKIIQEKLGDYPISLSHRIGGMGFIERENATILNAALMKVMKNGFNQLLVICEKLEIKAPIFITQNNGSLISIEEAIKYPVLTISAGPTNSFVGAVKLAGLNDAIVVDIGGTSTDVGIVQNGFPRRCLQNSTIGGVLLNFSMPDVISIALGGGSIIRGTDHEPIIGPESVARKLLQEAVSFGGTQMTLTDIALHLGFLNIPGMIQDVGLSSLKTKKVIDMAITRIQKLVNQLEAKEKDIPVVLVGGGAQLIPVDLLGLRYLLPSHASVANAYGAALAEVSVTINKVICLNNRELEVEMLKTQIINQVIAKGGSLESSRIVDFSITPYFYMPGNLARLTLTAAGKQDKKVF